MVPPVLAALLAVIAGQPPAAAQGMPDLRLDTKALANTAFDLLFFAPTSCALKPADLCVGAPGARKLLRFDVFAVNDGDADLVLGVPDPNELLPSGEHKWVYSECHHHFHFQTFARYELRRRGETTPFLEGQKRSFCVEDTKPDTATTPRKYCCAPGVTCELTGTQGVQPGWGDLYPRTLDCQWIDITDLPESILPAEFDLCVSLNTERILPDANPANDVGCIPVTIDGPPANAPGPKVKLRAPRGGARAEVGRHLKIAWRKRVRGTLKFQELWFSKDDGKTFALVAGGSELPAKRSSYRWTIPTDAVSDTARFRVVVWARNPPDDPGAGAYQRAIATSHPFRITP